MKRGRPRNAGRRGGFSLFELIVSLASSSVLLLGLGASLVVALKASDPTLVSTPSMLEGIARLGDLQADVQHATAITEQTATALTVTVPDRDDADTLPEIIRYAWSGTAGAPLTRQYNGGNVVAIANDVHQFQITYNAAGDGIGHATVQLQLSARAGSLVVGGIGFVNTP